MGLFGGSESYSGPSKKVKKAINNNLLPGVNEFNSNYSGDSLYSGTQLGDLDPLVTQGQDDALAVAGLYGDQYGTITDSLEGFLNYDPNSAANVASRDALNANVEAAFNHTIRPGIENRGTFAGQFGGPQQNLALGAATEPLSRALADAEVGLMNADENRALQALSMAPGLLAGQFLPSEVTRSVGGERTARDQATLMDEVLQFNQPFMNDLQALKASSGLYGDLSAATQHSSSKTDGDPFGTIAGLGLAGAGLGIFGGDGGILSSLMGGPDLVGGAKGLADKYSWLNMSDNAFEQSLGG